MTTDDCVTALFIRVDMVMGDVPKHPPATRIPSRSSSWRCCTLMKVPAARALASVPSTAG